MFKVREIPKQQLVRELGKYDIQSEMEHSVKSKHETDPKQWKNENVCQENCQCFIETCLFVLHLISSFECKK